MGCCLQHPYFCYSPLRAQQPISIIGAGIAACFLVVYVLLYV